MYFFIAFIVCTYYILAKLRVLVLAMNNFVDKFSVYPQRYWNHKIHYMLKVHKLIYLYSCCLTLFGINEKKFDLDFIQIYES